MKKFALALAALVIASVAVYGCKGNTGSKGGSEENASSEAPRKTMQLNVDPAEEKRLQDAVDNGSQVWRKQAVDVAHAALINHGINAKLEECKLTEDHGAHSVVNVKCRDGEFNITLRKLVKPDGIWTATDIELIGEFRGLGAPEAGHGDSGSSMHDHDHASHSH